MNQVLSFPDLGEPVDGHVGHPVVVHECRGDHKNVEDLVALEPKEILHRSGNQVYWIKRRGGWEREGGR